MNEWMLKAERVMASIWNVSVQEYLEFRGAADLVKQNRVAQVLLEMDMERRLEEQACAELVDNELAERRDIVIEEVRECAQS